MSDTDLGKIERDAFRKFYEDGLFDIALGAMLALMPLGGVLSDTGIGEAAETIVLIVAYGAVVVALMLAKRLIVKPRLGTFTPGPARKRRIRGARYVLLGSVVLGAVLFALPLLGSPPAGIMGWAPVIFLVNSVVVFGLLAYFLDVPRLSLYGFLFPAPVIARYWLPRYEGADAFIAFGIPAAVIVGIGLYKLTHFLREYPVRSTEVPGVS